MKGCKDGIFTCQLSESFHNVMKVNQIRNKPIVYIPEEVMKWEYNRTQILKEKCKKLLKGKLNYNKKIKNLIEDRCKNVDCYDIETITDGMFYAAVTSKFSSERFTHKINL